MSRTLFRYTTRSNWVIWVIFFAIMALYLSMIISMYDPEDAGAMSEMLTLLPKELVSAMGYDLVITDLASFMASYYYGFLIFLFPMIYCIIIGNRLVAAHVDRGSMAYLLSAPSSRVKIVLTQAAFLIVSVFLLIGMIGVVGLGFCQLMFPGELDGAAFLWLNLGAILLFLAVSAICFFFSCLFDDAKYSLALGAGIPVLFFVINTLSNVSTDYGWLNYLTLFSLYDPARILSGEQSIVTSCLIFTGIAAVLYGGGIYLFNRRDLSL